MTVFQERREKIYAWMAAENISMVMFEDTEARRDPSIRWMTGQPGDALLFLSADKRSVLVPWDINMARLYANADEVFPYTAFGREALKAIRAAAEYLKIPVGSRLGIPSVTSYNQFLKFVEALPEFDVICREEGAQQEAEKLRAVKDQEEILIYRQAADVTNTIIDLLEENVRSGAIKTEIDAAFFIEAQGRSRGCEGTGFETLAAGPDRSFGIHAFPAYTAGAFAAPGLSILDFGVKFHGYTTDVTMTFVRPPLKPAQERMLALTEKAYQLALSKAKNGAAVREISTAVDAFFARSKKNMPHGLGHGVGLEAHEAPRISSREDNEWELKPGMIITLEPGLYDPVLGGCRLENDVLITETGPEVLTRSRIVRL